MQINPALSLSLSAVKFWCCGWLARGLGWGGWQCPSAPSPPSQGWPPVPPQSPTPRWEPVGLPGCLGQITRGGGGQRCRDVGSATPGPWSRAGLGGRWQQSPWLCPHSWGEAEPGKGRNLTAATLFPWWGSGEGLAPATKLGRQPGVGAVSQLVAAGWEGQRCRAAAGP